jgi:Uma2 family endonuclease
MTTILGRVPIVTPANDVPGPEQGRWTYKDYAALPDDGRRYEIVDGVLFMTPSPTEGHQTAAGRLFYYLLTYVEFQGLGRVYMAPFDVELAPYVLVQPDVLVVLNANQEIITPSRIIGTPDLVVEVASPGTVAYDHRKKQDAYARAGVSEYWIVDPIAHTIDVLVLEAGTYDSLGVFEGQALLPSRIVPELPVRVEQFFS